MSATPARIRLLIADDHAFFRRGLRQACEMTEGFMVLGEVADGLEAVAAAQAQQPDVLLMDINMPQLDGIQATARIKAQLPGIQIIILTIQMEDQYVFDAIKAGASGYLLKDVDEETLIQAIRRVHQGESIINPQIATRVMAEFRRLSQRETATGWMEQLSSAEFDVLHLVAQGVDNPEIGEKLAISERTVTNRLSQIYQKLHLNNRTEAALYALRQGWAPLHPDASDLREGDEQTP